MNNNNTAISSWLLAIGFFAISNFSFSIFNSVNAQIKSSLQVDSINLKKIVATNLPIANTNESVLLVATDGTVRRISLNYLLSIAGVKALVMCPNCGYDGTNWVNAWVHTIEDNGGNLISWASSTASIGAAFRDDTDAGRNNGRVNTQRILEMFPTDLITNNAAKYCSSLGDGWYLPSVGELSRIYNFRDEISIIRQAYWASSEFASNSSFGSMIWFGDGNNGGNNKTSTISDRVRCMWRP